MDDTAAMRLALDQAHLARARGARAIGAAILAPNGVVLAACHDERGARGDPTAHAVMLAVREAAGRLGTWRLSGCSLAVTLEPCTMCAGACLAARLAEVVFGAPEPRFGALGSRYNLALDPRLNHSFSVRQGVLGAECALLADSEGDPAPSSDRAIGTGAER